MELMRKQDIGGNLMVGRFCESEGVTARNCGFGKEDSMEEWEGGGGNHEDRLIQ